jgi:DNA-binding IclR family transcriptional regulator
MATPITKVARLIEQLSKGLRITPRQTEMLLTIYEMKSITLDDLAALYNLKSSTTSTHVLKLIQKGYVEQDDHSGFDVFVVEKNHRHELNRLINLYMRRLKFTTMRLMQEHTHRTGRPDA